MKIRDFLENLDVKAFEAEARKDPRGYLRSYNHMLEAARRLSLKRDDTAFVGAAFLAYAWMPTALRTLDPNTIGDAKVLVSAAIQAEGREGFSETLKLLSDPPPINRSWVGTSKALHFLNPKVFPIWDRRVASHWGWRSHAQHNKKFRYETYATEVHDSVNHRRVKKLQGILTSIGCATTPVRTIELALFVTAAPDEDARTLTR